MQRSGDDCDGEGVEVIAVRESTGKSELMSSVLTGASTTRSSRVVSSMLK